MARTRIKWNYAAFAEIRSRPATLAAVERLADKIAESANENLKILPYSNSDGYVVTPAVVTGGRIRARAAVVTGDVSAMVDEARNHTLEALL